METRSREERGMPRFVSLCTTGGSEKRTLSHSDNSRVDSFLAKVRIQGNWPSQTASLPPRPPMQGAGTVPRHIAIENMVLAVGDNAVTYISAITLQRQPACPPAIPPR